ncbi:MAG: 3-dehydroquinate synthase [Opitutales bacterium]|nr:3-dehydroquinate synthase [Opitutales bacterium]
MTTLELSLGARSYPIVIGEGIVESQLRERLEAYRQAHRPIAVVTSPALFGLYRGLFKSLDEIASVIYVTSVDGEGAKSTAELVNLWETLAQAHIDRSGVLLAIGGGVVGDLGGFAAATFLRGIDFVQVPTTLLAMVDSSVGGKTAVNLAEGKNLVGAFYQPKAVIADLDFLKTLPAGEFAAGMGEVVKYGLLGDARLFETLEETNADSLAPIVRRCCEIKAAIVAADERETAGDGGRALLNLGHTFGHAIEKVAGYGSYLHGEAVAVGLMGAARLSEQLGFVPDKSVSPRVEALLAKYKLPSRLRKALPVEALAAAMASDKKVSAGTLKFVLLRSLGNAFTTRDVPAETVKNIWRELGACD